MLTLIRWIAINPLDSVIRLLNNWARVERHGFETRLGHYVVFLGKMFHSTVPIHENCGMLRLDQGRLC